MFSQIGLVQEVRASCQSRMTSAAAPAPAAYAAQASDGKGGGGKNRRVRAVPSASERIATAVTTGWLSARGTLTRSHAVRENAGEWLVGRYVLEDMSPLTWMPQTVPE